MKCISKRLLSLLLCAVLVVGLLPSTALAVTPVAVNIGTAEELAAIADGAYTLTADLTLTGEWTPVANFAGTLDGNGYTITLDGKPVFANITDTGRVINLLLAGEVTGTGEGITLGALAITSAGNIENCYSRANVKVTQVGAKHTGKLGGFVGNMTAGLIKNCLEYATVLAYTNADVSTTTGVGYIAGATAGTDCTVTACYSASGDALKKPINPVPNGNAGASACKQYTLVEAKAPAMLELLNDETIWAAEWTVWKTNDDGIPVPGNTKNTGEVDKTALNAAIAQAEELTQADYTAETWAVLAAALAAAQETAASEGATQAVVNTKAAELTAAIAGLKPDNSDATATERQALEDAIAAAERIEKTDLHITNTWVTFETALNEAKAVLENLSAEAQAITAATLALTTAQAGLKSWDAQVEAPGDRTVVEVSDAQGLIGMNPENYYKLVADFTVAQSIDTLSSVLDGNGHTITLTGNPLFTNIGETGVIQNLGLVGSVSASQSRASASFADLNCRGRILNSYSRVAVTGKSVAAGLVGILDGGFLHNVYFSGTLAVTDTSNLQDTRIAGLVNNYKSGAIHSAYWLEAQSKSAVSEGKYVSTSMGGLDMDDMQGESFRSELTLNRAGGLEWGQDDDGLPYHGADKGYTPPPGTGTYTYPVFFQRINDAGEPVGEKIELDAEGLVLTLADLTKEDDAGYLSMPGYEGPIKWSTSNSSINMYYPGYDDTRRDRILYASATGTATITVTDGAEKDPVVLASFQVKVTKGSLKDVKYYVGDTELTQGGTFTVAGHQWSTVTAKALYLGGADYMEVPASSTSVTVGFFDSKKATAAGRSFVLNQPDTPAKLTVSALGRSITFSATSTYVPVTSITPGANNQPAAEGSPEAKYKDEDGNYILHERNPNSATLVDFNKLQDTPNVIVEPANASYGQSWTLTSEDPTVAQFVDSLVVRVVPYKAGEVTFTATAKDPKETQAQKTGSSTAKFVYLNPVTGVSAPNGTSITVAENQSQALGLRLTGPRSEEGYHVSEADITWAFTSADGGEVEIFRSSPCVMVRSELEYYVANDQYQLRGVKAGTVTAVGTPVDQTKSAQPITLTITVTEGQAEEPAHIPTQLDLGITTGVHYLQNAQGEGDFAYNSEWEIFALLRSGVYLDEATLEPYFWSIAQTFQTPTANLLKPTTLARVALALTAAGQNPADFRGINFFALLGDNELMTTGSNEPMWTLIALDSKNYDSYGAWRRTALIAELLRYQNTETGGFGLTDNETTSVDITAMSIQALAPYYEQPAVKTAVDAALGYLRAAQNRNGGYDANCEATVQVLVALCALGLDPLDQANGFVKGINRNLVMDIMSYRVETAPFGFLHVAGTLPQVMTTDQAVYGLETYSRFLNGLNGVYNMTDVTVRGNLTGQMRYAGRLAEGDYTAESWKTLAAARLAAQAVLDNQAATEDQLTAAAVTLAAGVKALVRESAQPENPDKPEKPEDKTITVSFRLVGDTRHDDAETHGKYQTWIKTQRYTLPKDSTVYDVFEMALADHGMGFEETQPNYIGKVQAPGVLGGYWLGEFDNGAYSGWKYLVNGEYPGVGLRSLPVKNGDAVVWRYVDDFTNDFDNIDKWMEAPDVAPTAPSGGDAVVKPQEKPTEVKTEVKPTATTDKNGEAKAQLTAKDMAGAITDAKEGGASEIVIEPDVTGSASKVSVALPAEAAAAIARDTTARLTVKTSIADISIPVAALAELGQAEGKTVAISAETVKSESGKATGEIKLELKLGDKTVDVIKGGFTATVPVTGATAGTVLMLITDEGAKIIRKSAVGGSTLSALLEGSATVMVKDNAKTFSDVGDGHWGKDAVDFATSRELFQGTSASSFNPTGDMSRAMLFTVLARLEEQDTTTGSTWYEAPMLWAQKHNISDGTNPEDSMTREQLATMLYRYAKNLGVESGADERSITAFSDAGSVSPWATDAMTFCVSAGLLGGKGSDTLNPADTATRAEVAAVLQRLIPMLLK